MTTITKTALVARIQRALRHDSQRLRKTRSDYWHWQLGEYYVEDFCSRFIVDKYVDVEELGRRLGVLREQEQVQAEQVAA